MFDMRYHIVSIVAVFLALAIGIVFGSSIENRGVLKEQQERLVKSIEEDIGDIRKKNNSLQKQLQSQELFEAKVLPSLLKDTLKDKNVLLVYFDDTKSDTLKTISLDTLGKTKAGAQELILNRKKMSKMQSTQEVVSDKDDKLDGIQQLAVELASTSGTVFEQLQKDNIGNLPPDYLPVDAVVLFAGGAGPAKEEIALAKALSKQKVKTVFVDKTNNEHSKIDLFSKEKISTIDNIDMVYGKISLAYLLAGSNNGHYGIKPSARDLMPTLD